MSTKILVCSDTHGHIEALCEVIRTTPGIDRIFHLGDLVQDAYALEKRTGRKVLCVRGNNDIFEQEAPDELLVEVEGHRILLVHGHFQGVNQNAFRVCLAAKERGADLVLFGHTHRFEFGEQQGVTYLNPGSIAWPRGDGETSFAYLILEQGKKPLVERVFI